MNWTKLHKNYKGKWVSLKDNQETVIASGKTLKLVIEKSKKLGFEHPFVLRVPKNTNTLVG